jgi:hypothetical protein
MLMSNAVFWEARRNTLGLLILNLDLPVFGSRQT